MPAAAELRISHLGAEGDGVGRLDDGTLCYVAGSLPGELVRLTPAVRRGDGWTAEVAELVEASVHRAPPPCPHFGVCGGCVLQHCDAETGAAFKRDLLNRALRRGGFEPVAADIARTPPATRRRLDLAIARAGGRLLLGLHPRNGKDVVDLRSCPVTHPALVGLLPGLRRLLAGLDGVRREGAAVLNLLDSGVDVLLRTDAALSAPDRAVCARFAEAHGIPRISWSAGRQTETVAQLHPAELLICGVAVRPPPGAFLQASIPGEAAIRAAVRAGLPRCSGRARIVELYAGCGTLTFGLAAHARVQAYEGDAGAAAALRRAAGGRRIEVFERDLVRQPVSAAELKGAACVVLDPPFGGAGPQIGEIAASKVGRVIYVSCNPAALGRELAVLREAGYGLLSAQPIDQFLWSARLEAVVVLAHQARPVAAAPAVGDRRM